MSEFEPSEFKPSEFKPTNEYMIGSVIYQIFTEDNQTKKQYLLEQLNYYNQYKYFVDECAYNFNKNLPLPTPPPPPPQPNQ